MHPFTKLPDCHLSQTLLVGVMTPGRFKPSQRKKSWQLRAKNSEKVKVRMYPGDVPKF